ncbi:hypothetical protein B5F70_04735 [Collinsella sp. An268]|nr:type II toxin-antitoxin system RelB/DinJ family antitoxin [Collinsella intestinalis]OUO64626.1 hypothetical protein B5F70_04735 [Collinsella sp. An268]
MQKSAASASAKAVADATASLRTARSAYSERPQGEHAAKSKHKPAQSQVNARIDAKLKAEGDAALASAGFTPTQAVRMLWTLAVRCQGEPEKLRAALDPDSAEPSEDERAERQHKVEAYHSCLSQGQNVRAALGITGVDPDREGLSDQEYTDLLRGEHFREKGYLL